MNQLQDNIQEGLQTAGLSPNPAKGIAQGVTALTAAGWERQSVARRERQRRRRSMPNRQLHPVEQSLLKKLPAQAKAQGQNLSEDDIAAALRQSGIRGSDIGPDQRAVMNDPTSSDPTVTGARFDNTMPLMPNSGGVLVENIVPASPAAIAFVQQATGGANSPYYWSQQPRAASISNTPPDNGGPRYYTCATPDCLNQGANRNPSNTLNQADDAKQSNALIAAGVIVGAPVAVAYGGPLAFSMVANAQTLPLAGGLEGVSSFKWVQTLSLGSTIGAGLNFIMDPDASPASLAIGAVAGAVGGVVKFGTNVSAGLANQIIPTTRANAATQALGTSVGKSISTLAADQINTPATSWWTSPLMSCGVFPRKPC